MMVIVGSSGSALFELPIARKFVTPKHPPRVSPIGNNGFLFSRPRLKLIACGAGT